MWEKIVLNLLSNAFKFTFDGGIAVELKSSPDRRTALLVVSDTGVGIPRSELPKLFERFHRIEGQKSRSFEGSGIGLALVQELVRLHGGTVEVESGEGEGAVFTIAIPYGTNHLAADEIGKSRSRASTSLRADAFVEEALRWLPEDRNPEDAPDDRADEPFDFYLQGRTAGSRILVADDNSDMRAYVRRLLGSRWQVETVADGVQALAAMRARKPDLVLTDVMMPHLDGFGLLSEVRKDPELRDLPVIVLSARAGEDARVEGLDAKADDYLTKPFSARELLARVNANLEMALLRRETTRDLRESEARFRNMAEHAPVIMWMTDPDGSLTYINRLWTEYTGQSVEEALGSGAWETLHPDDREASRHGFLEARTERAPFRMECRLRRSDGSYRWAINAAGPRFGDDDEFLGHIGSVIDIADRKEAEQVLKQANVLLEQRVAAAIAERAQAEAQLLQAQKMEAVGRLTGGVAHDFNNVLQVISGNLQLLGRDVEGNARAEQRLQTAVSAISRGSKLASQLLAFGRRQPLAPKVVNLGRLISSFDDMLRRALGEGVEVETVIAGGLWNTFVDMVQVENALLNLAINARDAMEGHGKLTIEAGNAYLDDQYAARHTEVSPGQYVVIAVTDTGAGIPAEILESVFEPFFTTKPEGQGTGLGLSMVYGFVKQSGGHIKIYSEVGHGTTVRLYLPRSKNMEDVETDVEFGPATGGAETVLVVEDDEQVRHTVVDMLSELGYRVLKAKDAGSALAIIESGVPIDLLFTDVVMPGPLRSPELARKAKERLPSLAVLFTSGYTENAIVHGGRLDEGIELLSKPYSREALARKIRYCAEKPAAAPRSRVRLGGRPPGPRRERRPDCLFRSAAGASCGRRRPDSALHRRYARESRTFGGGSRRRAGGAREAGQRRVRRPRDRRQAARHVRGRPRPARCPTAPWPRRGLRDRLPDGAEQRRSPCGASGRCGAAETLRRAEHRGGAGKGDGGQNECGSAGAEACDRSAGAGELTHALIVTRRLVSLALDVRQHGMPLPHRAEAADQPPSGVRVDPQHRVSRISIAASAHATRNDAAPGVFPNARLRPQRRRPWDVAARRRLSRDLHLPSDRREHAEPGRGYGICVPLRAAFRLAGRDHGGSEPAMGRIEVHARMP